MGAPVRIRIALSPTGCLDVGTARTAIFNWLFARHSGGKFLVRLEDTDVEKSDSSFTLSTLNALKWVGLNWDEEVVYRSNRTEIYQTYVKELLENGHAYRCFCTPAEVEPELEDASATDAIPKCGRRCLKLSPLELKAKLDAGQPHVIRLKIPEGEMVYVDIVAGEIRRKNDDIEDFVAVSTDGSATHNFEVVIDDHEMGISHIIRGDDHVTDTIKQIHVYRALGWVAPEFGHVPLILHADRHKDVAAYRDEGILPQALFNYLSLLGWSPKTDREIYTTNELIELFDLHHFGRFKSAFDEEKLIAFNKAHIQLTPDHDLAVLVAPMLVEAGVTTKYWLETRWEYLRRVITLLKEHVRCVSDFVSLGGYFFSFDGRYEPEASAGQFDLDSADLLEALAARFEKLGEFTHETTEKTLESLADEKGLKKARLIDPTRLAVSGMSTGPELYDVLVVLTKPIVLERLKKAIEYMRRNHQITSQG